MVGRGREMGGREKQRTFPEEKPHLSILVQIRILKLTTHPSPPSNLLAQGTPSFRCWTGAQKPLLRLPRDLALSLEHETGKQAWRGGTISHPLQAEPREGKRSLVLWVRDA